MAGGAFQSDAFQSTAFQLGGVALTPSGTIVYLEADDNFEIIAKATIAANFVAVDADDTCAINAKGKVQCTLSDADESDELLIDAELIDAYVAAQLTIAEANDAGDFTARALIAGEFGATESEADDVMLSSFRARVDIASTFTDEDDVLAFQSFLVELLAVKSYVSMRDEPAAHARTTESLSATAKHSNKKAATCRITAT